MIAEDYVSFETAKLLREKGFDENCTQVYNLKNQHLLMADFYSIGKFVYNSYLNKERPELITAPTLQMAMKWLREVYDCPVEILWHWDANSQYSEWYFVHHMELKPLPQIQYYDTYEEACEAAIKYCLENLI